jgi:hypothetical protein
MKKIIIIAFISALSIGCSKTTTPGISIAGTWQVQSNKADFYALDGSLDYQEDYMTANDALKTILFTESNATLVAKNNTVKASSYVIIKENGKYYVQFTSGTLTDDDLVEITLDTPSLTLTAESFNIQYQKAGVLTTAAKVILKVTLTKQ